MLENADVQINNSNYIASVMWSCDKLLQKNQHRLCDYYVFILKKSTVSHTPKWMVYWLKIQNTNIKGFQELRRVIWFGRLHIKYYTNMSSMWDLYLYTSENVKIFKDKIKLVLSVYLQPLNDLSERNLDILMLQFGIKHPHNSDIKLHACPWAKLSI